MGTSPHQPPRFTIVMPTYQRRDMVVASVRALSAQEDAEPFEVVVVDDGSSDHSAAALRDLELGFTVRVVEQSNQGSAAARNRGAAAARGELLMFLDDDMEAHPRLLAEHARSHREGADAVFGHIPLHPRSPPTFLAASVGAWAEERLRALVERSGHLEVTDFLTGQMSLRRELFLLLGGFDANFTRGGKFGGADFDFGRRLVNAGYRMAFNADAVSWQLYVVSPRRYLSQWRDNGRARVMLARRYPDQTPRLRDRRERLADLLLWRWLRWPLRQAVLGLLAAGAETPRTLGWFWRVSDLEYFSGVRAAGGFPAPRPVRVVCYHAIADLRGGGGLEPYGIPPARFRFQLGLLARHMRVLDGDEFRRFLGGGGVPRRAVLITFDDCFQDLLDVAVPRLRERGIPAVAFAVTGLLGRTNEWSARSGEIRLALLDAAGLRTLSAADVEIGSHTRTHPTLRGLAPADIAIEIEGSLADLETIGLSRPSLLAYPYGEYDQAVERAAAAAGLAGAFTTRPGIARAGGEPFTIPRIEILREDHAVLFAWKLATGRRPIRVRTIMRRGRAAARRAAKWRLRRKETPR